MRELVLAHAAGARLGLEIRQAVGGNRRRIDEHDRTAVRFALLLRELEQVERAFDVDVVRRDRRELGARREQRREVKHAVDLELGQDAVEQAGVGDRAGELAPASGASVGSSGFTSSVMMADSVAASARHERVADFAAGAGDQDNRFPHVPEIVHDAPGLSPRAQRLGDEDIFGRRRPENIPPPFQTSDFSFRLKVSDSSRSSRSASSAPHVVGS